MSTNLAATKPCEGDGSNCPQCGTFSNGHGCEYAHGESFYCSKCSGSGVVLAYPELLEAGLVVRCDLRVCHVVDPDAAVLTFLSHEEAGCTGYLEEADPAQFVYKALRFFRRLGYCTLMSDKDGVSVYLDPIPEPPTSHGLDEYAACHQAIGKWAEGRQS